MNDFSRKKIVFFVGAAKAGTTSLYRALSRTEAIHLPKIKEPNFFSRGNSLIPGSGPGDIYATDKLSSLSEYLGNLNYGSVDKSIYLSDFSVSYLYDDKAAENIYRQFPQSKIVIVLRNPVIRAFSHYKHLRRDMRETLSFREALDIEEERILQGFEFSWHYKNMGFYYKQVKRYVDLFGSANVKVFIYEEVFKDEKRFFEELAGFLDCSCVADIQFDKSKFNQTGIPRNMFLAKVLNRPNLFRHLVKLILPRKVGGVIAENLRAINFSKDKLELSEDDYSYLHSYYLDDISSLSRLVRKDFSLWGYTS
ncbi:sulfotransferase domain-containing protein [Alteromonas gracilis]|uniref:sulfotransferase domain-containing protein n=1 Tax=Alteromonas gracilis TaxID=1479524 RepID=UPI002FE271A0